MQGLADQVPCHSRESKNPTRLCGFVDPRLRGGRSDAKPVEGQGRRDGAAMTEGVSEKRRGGSREGKGKAWRKRPGRFPTEAESAPAPSTVLANPAVSL